jgi:type III secretion protein C
MKKLLSILFILFLCTGFPQEVEKSTQHKINFSKVTASELLKFISRITKTSFIFNEKDLNFEVSFVSGKEAAEEEILHSVITLLEHRGFNVKGKGGCFVVEARPEGQPIEIKTLNLPKVHPISEEEVFHVYKLQYHQGNEIEAAIKQLASSTRKNDPSFIEAIASMQWIKSTNSLMISASAPTLKTIISLIKSLDTPQKQVYIEVLVIETDLKDGTSFGLNWSAQSRYKDRLNLGVTNSSSDREVASLRHRLNDVKSGLPTGRGFDLGVIGDLITHKGTTFLELGALVSAIQTDHSNSIVLHHKVIAQDNKMSKIFVGDNIPFAGSVVETIGPSQQTTSNIEYRDIGVSLNITPYIGENGIVTLEISEEITEAAEHLMAQTKQGSGILTTKTNMVNRVHVPDSHFLALTGMVRNKKYRAKTGIPCLGGLPFIGAALSHKDASSEKRNIIIFVKPTIIENFEDSDRISKSNWDSALKAVGDVGLIQEIQFTP